MQSSKKDRCVTADYELLLEGEEGIKVTNAVISRWSDKRSFSVGNAAETEENGFISVAFGPRKADPTNGNYLVLDTDYDNYAFVWSCKEYCIGDWCMGHRPLFWLLERRVGLTEEEYTDRLDQAFDALNGFTRDGRQTGVAYDEHSLNKLRHKMSVSIQENCDYVVSTTVEVPVETTQVPVETTEVTTEIVDEEV